MTALARTRSMQCALDGEDRCEGTVHAHHHTGRRGMGQKARDEETFPLCWRHHMDFHAASGYFRDWDKQKRRAWQDEMVERYRYDPDDVGF